MKIQTKQLNKDIADSLRIILNCKDKELMLAARNELPKEKTGLLKALEILGVYYYQKKQSPNFLIPTPEFAFYIPYANILDNPIISSKYDYYYEERRIFEEERKQNKFIDFQESVNRSWSQFIQPMENEISLAASSQSGNERLRNSGQGGLLFCTCTFTCHGEPVRGLTLVIRRARNFIRFLLMGNSELKNHISSLNINGQSIPMENGYGKIDLADVSSKLSPLYAIDDEGKQLEMNIVLDEKDK